ncbi:MAG: hemerythrin family protein [Bacteroidales bacterium]|nr:hemerythrin family protein [Bacteroidales bacterium]
MTEYKWSKELEFGIKEIDEQHHHIMDLVNDFSKMDTEFFSRDDILDVFNDVISYAHVHFQSEEKIFKEAGYPGTEEHIKEHQKLLLRINNLFLSFSEKDITHTVKEVAELLKEWIEDHLMRVDKKYVSFLLGKK